MAKKPFSIRLEEPTIKRFNALAAVLNVEKYELLNQMVLQAEGILTEDEKSAFEALLKIWKDKE